MIHRSIPYLLAGVLSTLAFSNSILLTNPSGERNNGIDRTSISDPSVPGWNADSGIAEIIGDRTDYGNGKWRFSLEDSAEMWQLTSHIISTGDAYSLRFDAAMFSGNLPSDGPVFVPSGTLIGGALLNGDFNDPVSTGSRDFADTPVWVNVSESDQTQATQSDLGVDGSRNAVLADSGLRNFAADTGHTLSTGDGFRVSFDWRDAGNWDDESDVVEVEVYTTNTDAIDGSRTVLETLTAPLSTQNSTYESAALTFGAVPASAVDKRLFVLFRGVDGNASTNGFARLDNFTLERGSYQTAPETPPRQIIAELYVEDGANRLPVASRTYDFKTPVAATWDHYHLAVPAGTLDVHAEKALGVQFRSNDLADGNFQSVDNIRLSVWPTGSASGAFSTDWDLTPDQPWAGPGYWANRLQDWRVRNNRVECVNGARERLTLHRPGTSIRGNGGDFILNVTTGLNTGSSSTTSRAGYLLGAAPNVDWRGALLVHDGMGRDFGLFLGITGGGNLVIEDYSAGSVNTLVSAPVSGGFVPNTRLQLDATYHSTPGTYTLTLTAFTAANTQIGTTTLDVPSDSVLGAFGLLSHFGSSAATHWFDDFSGSGAALHPETDRHLAILGAMHTLSGRTLKLTAQLSPLSLVSSPSVALDTWDGNTWIEVTTTPVDADPLSSYTATFAISSWNDAVDTPYRLRIQIEGTDYFWTGTIPRDPVDKEELVIAMTTCQRINDGNLQFNGFDWTPTMLWHPHTQTYSYIAKHQPDVLLAHGDQIYEAQPTGVDRSSEQNRQLDYLYKWNLWVLQVRDLTREIPTVALPDDHDIYQGNLWGEGGIATDTESTGGYKEPASWVRMVERTQTSNLPDPDPYNAVQPPPLVEQNIGVYFTGMVYGRLGFAILEDRKFKTGPNGSASIPLDQQQLLGGRQEDFLREWNKDWAGQDLKLVVSQSPLGNLNTHRGSGYSFGLNDRDTHGWPTHRRNDAWRLLRQSKMFQLAGDQHLGTLAHNGADAPRDAGISFTAPAMANFFPRIFDPVNTTSGTTSTVSPYKGDYYFDGTGTLPDGSTPNLTADDPHHFAILGSANSQEYYEQPTGIHPPNYNDRGAGYGITRVNRTTREITFECWPIYADPEYPQTGGQFADWPQTWRQTDNDGRVPTGYLPVIDSLWRANPVIRIFDESTNELIHAMRVRGTRYRPPVYDNSASYRVEIAYGDETVSELRTGQAPVLETTPLIHSFSALQPSILSGGETILSWDVSLAQSLSIDSGVGDVLSETIDGIGLVRVSPIASSTYTLTLNGQETATTIVRVYPGRTVWDDEHFTPQDQLDPEIFGGDKDPDEDGFSNDVEFQFQTDPRDSGSKPILQSRIVFTGDPAGVEFKMSTPVDSSSYHLVIEVAEELDRWQDVPSNSVVETGREDNPSQGTSRISVRLTDTLPVSFDKRFYRANWVLN